MKITKVKQEDRIDPRDDMPQFRIECRTCWDVSRWAA